jgi:hypothetical protein
MSVLIGVDMWKYMWKLEFIKYMIRKLGKDIITSVGIKCDNFEKLKEMDCMIPEIHEKMWKEN